MRISELLGEQGVRVPLESDRRRLAIGEICDAVLADRSAEERDEIRAAVLARERIEPTGIGFGIAVPHAPTTRLGDEIRVGIGVSRDGITFEGADDGPVHLIFLLLCPAHRPGRQIKMLARISRLMHDEGLREQLVAAPDPAALRTILGAYEEIHFG